MTFFIRSAFLFCRFVIDQVKHNFRLDVVRSIFRFTNVSTCDYRKNKCGENSAREDVSLLRNLLKRTSTARRAWRSRDDGTAEWEVHCEEARTYQRPQSCGKKRVAGRGQRIYIKKKKNEIIDSIFASSQKNLYCG